MFNFKVTQHLYLVIFLSISWSNLQAGMGGSKPARPLQEVELEECEGTIKKSSPVVLQPVLNLENLQRDVWGRVLLYIAPQDFIALILTNKRINQTVLGCYWHYCKNVTLHPDQLSKVPDVDKNGASHLRVKGRKVNVKYCKFNNTFQNLRSLSFNRVTEGWELIFDKERGIWFYDCSGTWLVRFMNDHPTVEGLDLSHCSIPASTLPKLSPYFRVLTALNLYGNPINNETALFLSVVRMPQLKRVNLWLTKPNRPWTAKKPTPPNLKKKAANGFVSLFNSLPISLEHLGLKASWYFKSELYKDDNLRRAIEHLTSLHSFELESDDSGLRKQDVLSLLPVCKNLRSLRLTHFGGVNKYSPSVRGIDDEVAEAIATHLPSLQTLYIRNRPEWDDGISIVGATSLSRLTGLRSLSIIHHHLDTSAVASLVRSLPIERIDIRGNYRIVDSLFDRGPSPSISIHTLNEIATSLPHLKALGIDSLCNEGIKVITNNLMHLRILCFGDPFAGDLIPKEQKPRCEELSALPKQLSKLSFLSYSNSQKAVVGKKGMTLLRQTYPRLILANEAETVDERDEIGFIKVCNDKEDSNG